MMKGKDKVKLVIIGVVLMLLTVGLSGCDEKYDPNPLEIDTGSEQEGALLPAIEEEEEFIALPEGKVIGDIDKMTVIHYETSTEQWVPTWGGGGVWKKQADGFCVLYEDIYAKGHVPVNSQRHRVNGTIQNIAGKELLSVLITMRFYNRDGFRIGRRDDPYGESDPYPDYILASLGAGETVDFDFTHERYGWSSTDPNYDKTASFVILVRDDSYLYEGTNGEE